MMPGNVVYLADRRDSGWRSVFAVDGESSTMYVYVNDISGEVEVVQMNDEGEAIRTTLDATDSAMFKAALASRKDT